MPYQIFETERLILKPADTEDAAFMLELLNTPKWLKNIGDRHVKTLADAETYIKQRLMVQFEKLGFGNYTLIRKADNKKIGSCGLYQRPGLDLIDIGFAFLPEYEGLGYGYEAASKLKYEAENTFGIKQLCAITAKHNLASQRLLEKLGLVHTTMVTLPGETEELLYYQIVLTP